MSKKYRKIPVVIEAVCWNGLNLSEVQEFVGENCKIDIYDAAWEVGMGPVHADIYIHTLEGDMHVSKGDYVIKGVNGEFYPCKPDIFWKTYEEVEEDDGMDYVSNIESLCLEIGRKLNRLPENTHVSAIFDNNESDTVIGWSILYNDTNKAVFMDDDGKPIVYGLEELFNLFE